MSKNACLICLKSMNKYPGLSLHIFPKNPYLRQEWLYRCGFIEDEVVSNRKICSLHFEPSCYKSVDESNSIRKILKPGSIPTIFPKGHTVLLNHTKCTTSGTTESTVPAMTTMQTPSPESVTPINNCMRTVRYTGEMSSSDFATPRKAKINFSKAKLKINLQKKIIRTLQTTVRRLKKKLSSMEDLYEHLKENAMISDEAHDDILIPSS